MTARVQLVEEGPRLVVMVPGSRLPDYDHDEEAERRDTWVKALCWLVACGLGLALYLWALPGLAAAVRWAWGLMQ